LKAALYHASSVTEDSQEFPEAYEAFIRARALTLKQVVELRKALREFLASTFRGKQFAILLLAVWPVKKGDVSLFQRFPTLLEGFENTLRFIDLPTIGKRNIERAATIARGEALLHIYVKEMTGRLFSEQTAILLQVGAESYGLEQGPDYSAGAVNRRYRRWFREKKNNDTKQMKLLIRRIKRNGDTFLKNFLEVRLLQASLEVGLYRSSLAFANSTLDRKPKPSMLDPFALLRRVTRAMPSS